MPVGASRSISLAFAALSLLIAAPTARAAESCPATHADLLAALKASVKPGGGPSNGGLDNNEWAAIVNRDGMVCAIAFSGAKVDDQWLGSRAIAAEKANTANGLSLKNFALSTANLYAPTQPGGPLFGLALSNPVNTTALFEGSAASFGTEHDPMLEKAVGGIIVFGGGLALYDEHGIVGGLGASGDTSCADHNIAWRIRHTMKLDRVPAGVNATTHNDAILYDIGPNGKSASGYGHPTCGGKEAEIATSLQAGTAK
jgi:uncharacterized protein GlcG (DUF336 family)